MSSSLAEGVTMRPLRHEDAVVVAELANDDERSFGVDAGLGPQDVLDWWTWTDLPQNSWMLEEGTRPVACGWVHSHDDVAVAAGVVRPEHKGGGLGAMLVDLAEARAAALACSVIRQFAIGRDTAARALFESRGYGEVRRHYTMAIELDEELPAAKLPEGVEIETLKEDDARAFHAAIGEAFEDEWGFASIPFDEWWPKRSGAPDFDPALWFLVRDGAEIAAFALCVDGREGGGLVRTLGVRKPWRRRGLGLALLRHAFREFRSRGFTRVTLGVDSENPTGATRLYERAGMRVEREYVTFEKELDHG